MNTVSRMKVTSSWSRGLELASRFEVTGWWRFLIVFDSSVSPLQHAIICLATGDCALCAQWLMNEVMTVIAIVIHSAMLWRMALFLTWETLQQTTSFLKWSRQFLFVFCPLVLVTPDAQHNMNPFSGHRMNGIVTPFCVLWVSNGNL